MKLSFNKIIEYLIRCLGIPQRAFGTITIKLQRGEPVHVTFEESFNLEILKSSELTINSTTMFTKHGAKNLEDNESSKIITEVKIHDDSPDMCDSKEEEKETKEENKENKQLNGE